MRERKEREKDSSIYENTDDRRKFGIQEKMKLRGEVERRTKKVSL